MEPNEQTIEQPEVDIGPKTAPETPELFEKLLKHCSDLYQKFDTSAYRKDKIKEIEESRRVYDQITTIASFPWDNASNYIMPLTTITVDNLEPRIVAGLSGREDPVIMTMKGMEKKDDVTLLIENFFNKELRNTVKLPGFTRQLTHNLLLEGTVYPFGQYEYLEDTIKDFVYDAQDQVVIAMNQETGRPEPQIEDATISVGDGVIPYMVPFNQILCADNIGTEQEWEDADVGRLIYPTYAELWAKRNQIGYMNIGPWLLQEKQESGAAGQQPEGQTTIGQGIEEATTTGTEVIECVEWYLKYPIYHTIRLDDQEQTNWTEEKIVVTVARKSNKIIRFMLQRDLVMSNRKMVKRIRLFPESDRSYGKSIYAKLRAVQDGGSEMFNQIINIAYICMIPFFFYGQRSGIPSNPKLVPGKGIPCESVKEILFADFKINPQQYMPFLDLWMSLWERLGSIGDLQVGRPSDLAGKNKTATEVMAVIEEGNVKHNYQASTIRDEYLGFVQLIYDLYYQYMPIQKTFRFNGRDQVIPRKAMKRGYIFDLSGTTEMANKLIERKEKEQVLSFFANDPIIDPVKIREDLLRSYGYTDAKEYIKPEISQVLAALAQNPEIIQVIGKYLQTKEQVKTEVEGNVRPFTKR